MSAILGREELGKASVYLLMVLMPRAMRDLVPLDIRDHKAKLIIAEISQLLTTQMAGARRKEPPFGAAYCRQRRCP